LELACVIKQMEVIVKGIKVGQEISLETPFKFDPFRSDNVV